MSGVNPQGVQVVSFRKPSSEELDHTFLWRIAKAAARAGSDRDLQPVPVRGGHRPQGPPGVARQAEAAGRRPRAPTFWNDRYDDLNAFERHLDRNGTKVVKFFLHVSKAEQKRRFMARLDNPDKQLEVQGRRRRRPGPLGRLHAGLRGRDHGDVDRVGAVVRPPRRPQARDAGDDRPPSWSTPSPPSTSSGRRSPPRTERRTRRHVSDSRPSPTDGAPARNSIVSSVEQQARAREHEWPERFRAPRSRAARGARARGPPGPAPPRPRRRSSPAADAGRHAGGVRQDDAARAMGGNAAPRRRPLARALQGARRPAPVRGRPVPGARTGAVDAGTDAPAPGQRRRPRPRRAIRRRARRWDRGDVDAHDRHRRRPRRRLQPRRCWTSSRRSSSSGLRRSTSSRRHGTSRGRTTTGPTSRTCSSSCGSTTSRSRLTRPRSSFGFSMEVTTRPAGSEDLVRETEGWAVGLVESISTGAPAVDRYLSDHVLSQESDAVATLPHLGVGAAPHERRALRCRARRPRWSGRARRARTFLDVRREGRRRRLVAPLPPDVPRVPPASSSAATSRRGRSSCSGEPPRGTCRASEVEAGVEYLIEAGDGDAVIEAAFTHGGALLARGRAGVVADWIDRLPPHALGEDVDVQLLRAAAILFGHDPGRTGEALAAVDAAPTASPGSSPLRTSSMATPRSSEATTRRRSPEPSACTSSRTAFLPTSLRTCWG